jgi:serine phosphatase RsbU (regulator of sigma subunit)/ligand-binding sensor domain-containing protein
MIQMRLSLHLMSKLIAFFLLFFWSGYYLAQITNYGSLPYRNYTQKDYQANPQIFDIAQDSRGLLYFANQRGILEYDGVVWRTIPTRHIEEARCLEFIQDGSLLVGTTAGFGVVKKDGRNRLVYESLSEKLGSYESREISDIIAFKDKIILKSGNLGVFVMNTKFELEKMIKYEKIRSFSIVADLLYFQVIDKGIMVYDGKSFTLLPNSVFFQDKRIVSLFEFKDRLHILTEAHGIFSYNDGNYHLEHWEEEENYVSYSAINDSLISVGSYTNGISVLDTHFRPIYTIDINKGLMDGFIKCQYTDRQHHLWLGTNNGISKIDIMSPIMKFENVFKKISIEDIYRYNGDLIISSQSGVFRFTKDFAIVKFPEINADAYGLNVLPVGNDSLLFISELSDVLVGSRDFKLKRIATGGPYNVKINPLNPNEYIVLHYDGIQLLEYLPASKTFIELAYVSNFAEGDLFNFIVTNDGTLWLGSNKDGVYKLHVKELLKNEPNIFRYFTSHGLPESQVFLFDYANTLYAGTDKGLFKYNQEKFIPSADFGKDFSNGKQGIHRISIDRQGQIWMILFNDDDNTFEVGYANEQNGQFEWHSEDFCAHADYIIHGLYHDANGITWLGGNDGLLRYDNNLKHCKDNTFSALLRSVYLGDSIIYYGVGELAYPFTFPYNPKKVVEFTYASNSFIVEDKIKYSYWLEGYETTWSEWSLKTAKEYTLSEGDYTFHVRAQNIYGEVSETSSFSFSVLPPWYRTWWAYLLFFVAGLALLIIIIRLSLRRVRLQNIRLEVIVKERTQEVVAQKAEVEKQRDIAEHQKHLIEEKNTEILDSINYAKRLQRAILPTFKQVTEILPNSFIYYKPKDIVAGDFYWLETYTPAQGGDSNVSLVNNPCKENIILLAAADCTGHGVPGALVSVVCSNALNRAVKEFNLSAPNTILDKVRELVIETFEKSESEVKDGMDISLVALIQRISEGTEQNTSVNGAQNSLRTHTIMWSGANNPLWIIRKPIGQSTPELIEIKPDKQPIGKYDNPTPFTLHTIEVKEGDTLFLFTDGFPDQFGGPKGKKFMYKAFKELLLEINALPMDEQLTHLRSVFHEWKNYRKPLEELTEYEQVDDVCIIGVRL